MQAVLDVLTPEQRMQITNRTGNLAALVPPVPIAAPMQATGNVSGAPPNSAPPPRPWAAQAGVASGYGGGVLPALHDLQAVDQARQHHQATRWGSTPPQMDYFQKEEDAIRIKGLQDLVIPDPPTDAGQASGYTNQVVLAVGKLQMKFICGSKVQEVRSKSEAELKNDPSFPRLDRELAAKLVKTCKKGRFGCFSNKW